MGRMGSKASVQSHQLNEGNLFTVAEMYGGCQGLCDQGIMKKYIESWNQDDKHIEVDDIHKTDC